MTGVRRTGIVPRRLAAAVVACLVVGIGAETAMCRDGLETPNPPGGTAPLVRPAPPHSVLERLPPVAPSESPAADFTPLPNLQPPSTQLAPWWQDQVAQRMSPSDAHHIRLDQLLLEALQYSPRVQAINNQFLAREQTITEADAQFDARTFMESKFDRASDPVGNLLTVGGSGSRFRENNWQYSAGLRKQTRTGGSWELSQQFGTLTNNSQFLSPAQQGNARLSLSLTQPLLNGAGRDYNDHLIVLATIDTQVARDELLKVLQEHLLAVTEAYWELYFQRAVLLQKQRHYQRATAILGELEARRELDALVSEIARARAAVAARYSELIRAGTMIQNAQARLRALVSGPNMQDRRRELLPQDQPADQLIEVRLDDALVTALEHRPEIDAATQKVEAARVRLNVSRNELLPVLDVVLESYVSGLAGDFGVGQAWVDQFSVGEPGFSTGLVFEFPFGNREAQARHVRRNLELQQLSAQFRATVEALSVEVQVAVREVETAYREMQARATAVAAAEQAVDSQMERLKLDLGEPRSAAFLSADLANLLDAQDRLAAEELRMANAQRVYTVSLTALKRVTGTLLQHQPVAQHATSDIGLPRP